jgi:pyridoxine kinase
VNVLSIQSSVVYGRVGNRAAGPVLERLGHDVWPVDTVAFSNHPAHGSFRGRVVPAAEVRDLVEGLAARGVLGRCDAVLSGYLGDAATGAVVEDAVARVRDANPRTLYCCDPVIGEVGRGAYVRAGIPEAFRDRLVPLADIVTPNPFELELLSGVAPADLPAAQAAARALLGRGSGLVVATGLQLAEAPGQLAVLALTRDEAWLVRHPRRVVRVWGTGDAFAALFLGAFLPRRDARAALEHAVAALDGVLAVAERTDADELPLVTAQDALVHPWARFSAEPVG